MPRVLIPTNDPDFTLGLVEGYRSLGWEVVTGASNFANRSAGYDVIHYQWPEEYSDWQIPSADRLENIKEHLQWWASRAINIFSVNNLYPHNGIGDAAYNRLYSCFYQNCHLITHYSHASFRLVRDEFPAARQARHVVHSPPNYAVTLGRQKKRGSRRAEMGIDEREFVILIFCRLRSIQEMDLIRRAFDLAKIPRKRLLMAGKVHFNIDPFTKYFTIVPWEVWLRRTHAVVETGHVPENEVSRFLDSSQCGCGSSAQRTLLRCSTRGYDIRPDGDCAELRSLPGLFYGQSKPAL